MRCTHCLLLDPKSAALALDELHQRLKDCGDCSLAGAGPPPENGAAVVQLLFSKHLEAARELRRARNHSRKLAAELDELHGHMVRSEERIALLENTQKASVQEAEEELRARLALINRQRAEIFALATPMIHVWEGVVVLPLIGSIDVERARVLMDSVLGEVERTGVAHVVLDITGVQDVNADTAHALLQILQAVRLLGARALISGVRGAVAQSLVATGADLSSMHAVPSLRAALRACGVREHRLALTAVAPERRR